MRLVGEAWQEFFNSFEASAFRLETLPTYSVSAEVETIRRHSAGERPPADYHYPWLDQLAAYRAAGRVVQRVRIVCRPLSEYLSYEFVWHYAYNVRAGEDIRVLDLTDGPELDLPNDFWMFDERTIVDMLYEADGTQIGRELLVEPDVNSYIQCRDTLWTLAVPFEEYVAG